MNNANRKTSLKWKDAIIIGGVITNTLLSTVIISQLEDIYEKQVQILQNENDTYYAIGDMANYLADEINKIEPNIAYVEDISCKSGTKSKSNKSEYNVPDYDTSFKTYMDYRTITDKSSAQYMLQMEAYTDDMGLRKYGDHYIVAMGAYYSDNVGDTFKITPDNVSSFNVTI